MTLREIWMVLKSMYPHSFKEYGPVDGPVYKYWQSELEGVDLRPGYKALQTSTSTWPPSLPEFKQMCGTLTALPKNDEDMRKWALANGLGDAKPTESWQQYRARLEAVIERTSESGQRLLT